MNDRAAPQGATDLITPEALRLVAAVAREGSMAAAGRALGLVPSAVTYRVRHIEDALDVLLFDRSARQAKLTAAGKALLSEGQRVLQELDAVARRVQRVATGWESELRIATDSLISQRTLMELCEAFFACGPGGSAPPTRVRLQRETLAGTWHSLLDGRSDLAIGVATDGTGQPGIGVRPIGEVPFVFAVAPHHALAALPEPLTDATIREHRIVAVADSTLRAHSGATVGILAGQDVITVSSMPDKLLAQLRGIGCGFLPRVLAQPYIEAGQLVAKRTQRPGRSSRVSIAWKEPPAGPAPKALAWWLKQMESPATLNALLARH